MASGFDPLIFTTGHENFICTICMGVARDCIETECGHLFCYICIKKHTERSPSVGCPIDRQPIVRVHPNHFIRRTILNLPVKCPQAKHGCLWIGNIRDLYGGSGFSPASQKEEEIEAPEGQGLAHLFVCDFGEISCRYCHTAVAKNDTGHEITCLKWPVNCEFCHNVVERAKMEDHLKECLEIPLDCPHLGCGLRMTRIKLSRHISAECLKRQVTCPCSLYGCTASFVCDQLSSHNETNKMKHLELKLEFTLKENDKLREEVERLKDQSKNINSVTASLVYRLEHLESELNGCDQIREKRLGQALDFAPRRRLVMLPSSQHS